MTITLDNIELNVYKKFLWTTIYIDYNGKTTLVNKDKLPRTIEIIKGNYEIIKSYYLSNLTKNNATDLSDLNTICVKILLYYIDQYSRWKVQYKKSNYDIKFYTKDFEHPSTNDLIVFHLIEKHPDNWKSISSQYLNMSQTEFEEYWKNREAYFNK